MTLEDEVRQSIVAAEESAASRPGSHNTREALIPQYGLYLKLLARGERPLLNRADDFLRVASAMRDPDVFAGLPDPALQSHPDHLLRSPLFLLSSYLDRLPGVVLLMMETGPKCLVLLTLRGGDGDLGSRLTLERGGTAFLESTLAMMTQQRLDIERIERRDPVTAELYEPLKVAATALWSDFPPLARTALASADTILFLPSAFGDLPTFPLELLYSATGWLGCEKKISRLHSLRTVMEMLSPNRMPGRLLPRAAIVRASDTSDLQASDVEIDSVRKGLFRIGLDPRIDAAPTVSTLQESLDEGLTVLHYCGHGFAGHLGESLPLAKGESFGPPNLSQLSGYATPFVYLSTCEVGRSRMGTTGSALGISARFIEKGAPAVVGCLQSVPDTVAAEMAEAFYNEATDHPAAAALMRARHGLARYPPACWGTFVFSGDPFFRLSPSPDDRTANRTLRWDSYVGRYLATRDATYREWAANALVADPRFDEAGRAPILTWLQQAFESSNPDLLDWRLECCRKLALEDTVASGELRMLLSAEILDGCYQGEPRPHIIVAPEEVRFGLVTSAAIHDTLTWSFFAVQAARVPGAAGHRDQVKLLDQAIGMLEGWAHHDSGAVKLLDDARKLRAAAIV